MGRAADQGRAVGRRPGTTKPPRPATPGMEIQDVETIQFTYDSYKTRDEKGHSHPAEEPTEAVGTITRVVTDEGDGYCLGGHPDTNAVAAEYITGKHPLEREVIWKRLMRTQRLNKAALEDSHLGAVDAALWDFAGRYLDQPVYRLLGGAREKVPAYASTMVGDDDPDGLGTPEAYADFAADLVDRGYQAIKLHTWMPPYSEDPERDLEAARAVREAVGPDIDLMVDAHHYYSRQEAKTLGEGLDELDYRWIEEPMNEHSMSSYEWLTEELDIAVIGPETAEGKMQTRAEWIKRGIADVSRVGVFDVGGITPAWKTVSLCESFGVQCEVHGGGPANLHLVAAMPIDGEFYERGLLHPAVDYESPPPYLESIHDPMDDGGYVQPSEAPGLGWQFDWEYIDANRVE
jgi:L-alanine-DL-glutamate epimerase-like enolase superfamily enzyme